MFSILFKPPLIIPLIFLFGLSQIQAQPYSRNEDVNDDEKAVKAATMQFYSALNAMFVGNLEPMKEVWSHADDVTYMGPAGGIRVGWKAVLADWEAQAALNLGGKVVPSKFYIIIGPKIATVINEEKGENVDPDGNPLQVSIRATHVFRKEKGRWKMIGDHTDLLPFLQK